MPKLQQSEKNGFFIHFSDPIIHHMKWKKGDSINICCPDDAMIVLRKLSGDIA